MRKFTIRTLLLLVAIFAIVLAFDLAATNRKKKFVDALEMSPTKTLNTSNDGYAACWQRVTGITDSTSALDRLFLRRKISVEHTLHVLWKDADDEIEPRTADSRVVISWNGTEIETGYHVGMAHWLPRNATKIPDDAIRRITMR